VLEQLELRLSDMEEDASRYIFNQAFRGMTRRYGRGDVE
jgi:hypothetical protein